MIGAIRNVLVKHFVDSNRDPRRTLLITSAGRGGSTWLAELLNYRNDFRYMFEPFYAGEVPAAAAFANWQYLRPNEDSPAHLRYADEVLTGRLRHDRVDMYNRRLFCSRRLVKEVRANLMIGWLAKNFPGMKIIYLLRHPLATVRSRLAHTPAMDLQAEFVSQEKLVFDHLAPHLDRIAQARTDFERHVIAWCIEYLVAERQIATCEHRTVYYESLSANPDGEAGRLMDYADIPFDRERLARAVRRPSATALDRAGAIAKGDDLVDTWRSAFTAEQLRWALETIDAFGLSYLYGGELMPLRRA
ncbi:MAG TPA: sulfotransferase [Candidatus Eremiobacteraceae bacterium]|nr:sulfotransferase [Candidatus Eremiobacteraceae bacterium]